MWYSQSSAMARGNFTNPTMTKDDTDNDSGKGTKGIHKRKKSRKQVLTADRINQASAKSKPAQLDSYISALMKDVLKKHPNTTKKHLSLEAKLIISDIATELIGQIGVNSMTMCVSNKRKLLSAGNAQQGVRCVLHGPMLKYALAYSQKAVENMHASHAKSGVAPESLADE
jgi:hypothetical protein